MSNNEDGFDKTSIVPSDTLKVKLAQADEAPPALVLLVGPAPLIGKQWLLEKAENIIGRADSSDIQVDDRSISKSHAKVSLYEGEVTLIDLESTNKTIINNKILKPLLPHELKNNDQIKSKNENHSEAHENGIFKRFVPISSKQRFCSAYQLYSCWC